MSVAESREHGQISH